MTFDLLFDLDGTLVDTVYVSSDVLNEMLQERGSRRVIKPEETRPLVTLGGEAMIAGLFGDDCVDPLVDVAEYRRLCAGRDTHDDSLFPGVREGIERLYALGMKMAVCSNKPQNLVEKIMSDLGFDKYMVALVGARPDLPRKPNPALLNVALEEMKGNSQNCWFIGDGETDQEASAALGIPFIFTSYGYGTPIEGVPIEVTCPDFKSVTDFLEQKAKA
ncbi:HAD family hydrolase [Zymomonas mobilis]|uniref:phosphoglycolate phosphatase n=1 Tax=Zymomonas mobilis subsp. mobilis (strain ATCC 10988 / DSM 424 / LMG 404 / NCIMB 8938 / NRRL B-806 / ZM1) TaxID=555217 RepID=A0A0H3FZT6_ZYMMA|nr:HAD hydrolase-like protein [Zymomonas mobilis]AEH63172.1 Haloacid dehalogenase domain protein hydrolase [Zymomonas mobilis subsp. mobilis ATCC 10988]TQL27214.1 phosphoglycolate phosphatase [Zymomonas mobilis]TQL28644.1 phosphoglycolate phosphatase [Zymomonas mobilis]